jgi:hypothetical protein
MSKSIGRRQAPANNNKVPLVLQRLLVGAKNSDGTVLMGDRFAAQYKHNNQVSIVGSKAFQDDMNALHETNPFRKVKYGRGEFSYVPVELAARIELLHAKHGLEAVGKDNQGKGWSYAQMTIDEEKPFNLPPSTDHTKFTTLVESEEIYASDEEKEAMKALLAAMAADLETNDVADQPAAEA